jgi:serine protease
VRSTSCSPIRILPRGSTLRASAASAPAGDALLLDCWQPHPPGPGEALSVEYFNASLDHYFMTAYANEVSILDAGVAIPGWARTGYTFNVYPPESTVGAAACRFFGKPGVDPNTHFFTLLANECQDVKNNPLWIFEGLVFRTEGPDAIGACAANRVPAIRMHNNGKGGRANHRYLTSHSEVGVMLDRGWIVEGPVFCTPP